MRFRCLAARSWLPLAWSCTVLAALLPEPALGQPPFPLPLTARQTRVANPAGGWNVTTEVCNQTAGAKQVAWWSHPRNAAGFKIGARQWHPAGIATDPVNPDNPDPAAMGVPIPAPVGGVPSCISNTDAYPAAGGQPQTTYLRVFERMAGPPPTWTPRVIIPHNSHLAATGCIFELDPPASVLVTRIPIPYPEDLNDLTRERLTFFLQEVSLPAGWELAFLSPGLEEGFELGPDQKDFVATLAAFLPLDPAPSDGSAVGLAAIEVTWAVRPTPEIEELSPYRKTVRDVTLFDRAPPQLRFEVRRSGRDAVVTVAATDPGGIHQLPRLTVTRTRRGATTSETCIVPLGQVGTVSDETAIGITSATYQIRMPRRQLRRSTLQVTLPDQCGNAAEVLQEIGRIPRR